MTSRIGRELDAVGSQEGGRRLRVLVSAFSCIPGTGSEPGAGWLWAAAAATRHDVWLLSWDGYREQVEAELARRPELGIRPIFVAQSRWLPGGPGDLRVLRARYLAWQGRAHRAAMIAHAEVGFDVAHHLTLASDWMPPGVGGIPGVPLVWGPVGGYSHSAWSMARWLGWRWVVDETGRRATTGLFRAVSGRWAARRAALVVAQNHDVAVRLRRLGASRVEVEANVALEARAAGGGHEAGPPCSTPAHPGIGRAVFAGRLVRWKGAAVAIRAMSDPRLGHWTLDVYGDGEDRARLERLRDGLCLGARVRFHGMRDRSEVRTAFAAADVLVLPSLNDSAGWVIAEAAAEGCPTVCLDRGGPPDLCAAGAGVAVPVGPGLPARVASAMLEARRLPSPLGRWSTARLPSLVDGWYHAVAGDAGGRPGADTPGEGPHRAPDMSRPRGA